MFRYFSFRHSHCISPPVHLWPDCLVIVHDSSCRDHILDCNKFRLAKKPNQLTLQVPGTLAASFIRLQPETDANRTFRFTLFIFSLATSGVKSPVSNSPTGSTSTSPQHGGSVHASPQHSPIGSPLQTPSHSSSSLLPSSGRKVISSSLTAVNSSGSVAKSNSIVYSPK